MTQLPDTIALPNEATYESLISLIENSQEQLALIIVACDDLRLRQQIIERYEREANQEQIRVERIVLGTEPSLRAGLARLELPPAVRVVVTVTGAEWLLRVKTRSADEQSDLDKFFGYLQWTREGLREFRHPIVLWVTFPILREMSRKAPDFWSWRKAVLRFTSETSEPIIPVVQHVPERSFDRQNNDFLPPPEEILSEIHQLEANNPASANLATLYQKLAGVYAARIARGEATNLDREQQQAIEAFERAIDLYRELNEPSALANTLNNFGNFLFYRSSYQTAVDLYQHSLDVYNEIDDLHGQANSLNNLGIAYKALGKYNQAIEFHQQSLKIYHVIGDLHGAASSLNGLGSACVFAGQYNQAIEFHQQSLKIYRVIGSHDGEASSLGNLGNVYYSLGQYQRAIDFSLQSLEIYRVIGDLYGEASSLGSLGNAYYSLGQYQRAIDFSLQSLEIYRAIGDLYGEASSLNILGNAYRSLGQYQRAIDFYQQSLEIYHVIGDLHGEALSIGNLGSIYDSLEQYPLAVELDRQCLEIQRKIGDRHGEANTLFNQALTLAKYNIESPVDAIDMFKQACAIYIELKLDIKVEECNKVIYNLDRIIATEESHSVPIINN
jgi:tetratricopeptide (TPR) repeat protein